MATAWLSVYGEVFPYWLHHGIPRPDILSGRLQIMGRRSSNSFLRYWCSLGEIALKLPLNHVWNLPAASIRSLGLTWDIAFYAPSALRPGASWDFRSHPKSLASIHFFYFHSFKLWFLMISCSQPCVESKLSKSNDVLIIRWHLPYGMSIVINLQ